jgi:hypothetical protein
MAIAKFTEVYFAGHSEMFGKGCGRRRRREGEEEQKEWKLSYCEEG